jgi:hypothetical protein
MPNVALRRERMTRFDLIRGEPKGGENNNNNNKKMGQTSCRADSNESEMKRESKS